MTEVVSPSKLGEFNALEAQTKHQGHDLNKFLSNEQFEGQDYVPKAVEPGNNLQRALSARQVQMIAIGKDTMVNFACIR
jgi:amino acid permease